jgi:hypothetical protein
LSPATAKDSGKTRFRFKDEKGEEVFIKEGLKDDVFGHAHPMACVESCPVYISALIKSLTYEEAVC